MTTEQRISNLEDAMLTLAEVVRQQAEVVRQQGETLTSGVLKLVEVVSAQEEQLAEYRRDARQVQHLLVYLARKNGWLDDEDWPPPEEPGK